MRFSSNPGFVFHDSAGLESGSQVEKDKLIEFIAEKAKRPKKEDRLHMIM